ncbi:transient receptor potential cation channel subfamily a member 1-like [Gigaspora margarita]|uniref:Transient receptor potential cation channel subfamily a member 1-like n=1 Tax=Gigaspora margarita TaxID=4874 RepID=A0A8H4EML3_GIGMA|nr:transient receptor potential cation channel subfamily a member 1-like [Gigaspora margarita]
MKTYYMMITGDSTLMSSWILSENFIIMLLMTIASFIIVIYLMHILTGVLCDAAINDDNILAYLALKKEKTYVSENLNKFFMFPEEQPSLLEIEEWIMNQLNTLKNIETNIKDLSVLKQELIESIENKNEDMFILKQGYKKLKESIEDMKTNK